MSTRIVILGGGFAGLMTARRLRRRCRGRTDVQITLVSRDNYFQLTPLLFEAGSGILEPRHAVNPIRPMFPRASVRFVEAEITGVDLDRNVVEGKLVHREPYEIPFDHLVIALGGITNTSLVPGSDKAMTFKTLADAIFLRNHVIQCCEQADVEQNEAKKRGLLTFAIVGAGLVGVELQGELNEFLLHLCKHYPNISPAMFRFELIEAGPRIMPEMDADLAEYATQVYRDRGINVRVNMKVKAIEEGKLTLETGEVIEAQTIVVATGVKPSPLIEKISLETDRKGRIVVDATMRAKDRQNIWALGDCAAVPDPSGEPYPPLAQHAIRMGPVLADNIVAAMNNQPLKPFIYQALGTLAALGRYKGVAKIMKLKLRGFPAWFVWRTYYLFQMPLWSRRLRIMLDWTVALLFSYDVVQLDLIRDEKISRAEQQKRSST